MGIARKHVNCLNVISIYFPFQNFTLGVIEIALLDKSVTFDYDELLKLSVVPVLAFGDAGLGDVDAEC